MDFQAQLHSTLFPLQSLAGPVTHLSRQFQGLSATEDAVVCAVLRRGNPPYLVAWLDDKGLLKVLIVQVTLW